MLEDPSVVAALKTRFAPDGGAEREHNGGADSCGFAAIHYALVRNLRPKRALVIGSRYGYIPAAIAMALKASGLGHLDFVDANYSDALHGFQTACGGVGNWSGDATARFREMELNDVVDIHIMRSAEFFEQCRERYGYVYLDGNHTYAGCRSDFDAALELIERGAIIALHDVMVTDAPFGVHKVVAELCLERYGVIAIPVWPGLALVQVHETGEYG